MLLPVRPYPAAAKTADTTAAAAFDAGYPSAVADALRASRV